MSEIPEGFEIPTSYVRKGLVIPRAASTVVGDPCIVWDEEIGTWRMFLFQDPPGHGQTTCLATKDGVPTNWSKVEPLVFRGNGGYNHKPYIVQEAHKPNQPARINGQFWLVCVEFVDGHKEVRRARSSSLAGPWTWDAEILIPRGGESAFDERHVDAISGFYFPERDEVLYFYMGYPRRPQDRKISPLGNAQGLAVQSAKLDSATKLGMFLPPMQQDGHWASGYLGGLQLLPGRSHRWIALLNASPTAPRSDDTSIAREEPAPSLGGWAFCDEEWPIKNWHFSEQPIEWMADIPATALGEETNLWRHHALVLPDKRMAIYYNSGYYGKEQLYMKLASSL